MTKLIKLQNGEKTSFVEVDMEVWQFLYLMEQLGGSKKIEEANTNDIGEGEEGYAA